MKLEVGLLVVHNNQTIYEVQYIHTGSMQVRNLISGHRQLTSSFEEYKPFWFQIGDMMMLNNERFTVASLHYDDLRDGFLVGLMDCWFRRSSEWLYLVEEANVEFVQ